MRARAEHLFARTITRPAVPFRLPMPARRNPDTPVPARRTYRPPRRYPSHSRTPYAPGEPGRAVPSPVLPYRSDCPCRRAGTLTRLYRHDGHTVHHGATRAIAVPPTRRRHHGSWPPAAGRHHGSWPPAAGRHHGSWPPAAGRHHGSWPPAAGRHHGSWPTPGNGDGNAEQSAPAARSVAIARRASNTDSGSPAS